MFRKDETAINEWSPGHVRMCAERQRTILEQAVLMLKPGGTLVYSTCTFSAEENEGVIGSFLKEHQEFSIEESPQEKFFAHGRIDWTTFLADGDTHSSEAGTGIDGIGYTMRLWPHKLAGEGHFIAKLKKVGTLELTQSYVNHPANGNGRSAAEGSVPCRTFLREELGLSDEAYGDFESKGVFLPFGEQVYLVPRQMISLKGLKVIRPGLHLGTNKKNRFEPSHALALYLSPDMVKKHYEMTSEQAESYLRGETFACGEAASGKARKGWTLLTINGYAAGFGKAGNGQMKNHYPRGLRKERTAICQNG